MTCAPGPRAVKLQPCDWELLRELERELCARLTWHPWERPHLPNARVVRHALRTTLRTYRTPSGATGAQPHE